MENNHSEEGEVAQVLALPLKSKSRKAAWLELSRRGDYKANVESLKSNAGKLNVTRDTGVSDSAIEYVPCTYCYGFFYSKTLYKHAKTCFMRPSGKSDDPQGRSLLRAGRVLLEMAVTDSDFKEIHTVLAKMKRDELYMIIRNDQSFLLYGTIMLQKKEKDRYSDIRFSLRCLARVLREFRKTSGKLSARGNDLVLSQNYDHMLKAAKSLSGYEGPRTIQTPSLFLKIGFCLRNLAEYSRCVALKEDDQHTIHQIRNFFELYDSDWQIYANNARGTYDAKKANQPEELPLEVDVRIFRKFVVEEIERIMDVLKTGSVDVQNLKDLAKFTLARLLTFNARRGGECSKLTLRHWEGVEDGRWKRRTDIDNLDDILEKKLAERLEICYIEGKKKKASRNAIVPILFTPETVVAVRILIKHRQLMAISSDNTYIFASGDLYLKGWDTLQAITKRVSNLQKPKLITPTRTRKYLATLLQLMDLTEAELTWLTNHFGHCKNTHFQWYRKEDATIELTKVAKVLSAVDDGKNVKNKKIDEIQELQNSGTVAAELDNDQVSNGGIDVADDVGINCGDMTDDGMCFAICLIRVYKGSP